MKVLQPLGKAGQQASKGSAVTQGTAEAGRMCLSWAGVSGTSILKEVAPELNLERQACLASKTSEKHSRQIKWEEQRQHRHESIQGVGELQVDWNDGTWVDADECGSREKRSGQASD